MHDYVPSQARVGWQLSGNSVTLARYGFHLQGTLLYAIQVGGTSRKSDRSPARDPGVAKPAVNSIRLDKITANLNGAESAICKF